MKLQKSQWMYRFLILVLTASTLGMFGCAVEQTEEGDMPEVEVEAEEGNLPEYDVDAADVDVDTETEEVTVPDVDVETETEEVTVPDVDVDMPDDDEDGDGDMDSTS